MATKATQQDKSPTIRKLAIGFDRLLERLVYLSPLVLLLFLALEWVRDFGTAILVGATLAAMIWAVYDIAG